MTEAELITQINQELTLSCALPYSLNETEIKRIIMRAREWMYQNYQYAVEEKFMSLPKEIFKHPTFTSTRQVQMPDCVVSIYMMQEVSGIGILGNPDRDFSEAKLLGAEIFLSPFQGDNLLYRTAMYSYFDLAKAYDLITVAYSFNRNTKRITVVGRNPFKDCWVRAGVKIPEESLYDDEIFVRYCLADAKIHLGRTLGVFNYNLPGGVTINFEGIKADGKEEMDAIKAQIDGENSPGWFLQWN